MLRKALNISEHVFAHDKLLTQLVPIVVETLGEAYPEMAAKQQAVIDLICHEQEVYKNLRESSSKAFAEVLMEFPNLDDIDLMECPGFVPAYREFQMQRSKFSNNTIPGDFLYKLTDTYGLTEESFLKLAELENMNCDLERYRAEVSLAKLKAKGNQRETAGGSLCNLATEQRIAEAQAMLTKRLTPTDNSHKYTYSFDKESDSYQIPPLKTRVLGMLLNDAEVSRTQGSRIQQPSTDLISIVTAGSNFYYESGGQQSDGGKILVSNHQQPDHPHSLDVIGVKHLNDCVVHICKLSSPTDAFQLAIGDEVELQVDAQQRQLNTCHHTGEMNMLELLEPITINPYNSSHASTKRRHPIAFQEGHLPGLQFCEQRSVQAGAGTPGQAHSKDRCTAYRGSDQVGRPDIRNFYEFNLQSFAIVALSALLRRLKFNC